MAAVGPDSAVEESNLHHNVCILHSARGEKVAGQKYVEPVARQGYRIGAGVQVFGGMDEASPATLWRMTRIQFRLFHDPV